jgi:Flp pilus assembly pilin Flp
VTTAQATAVEYGIMVGFIAVVIVLGVTAVGTSVQGLFEMIAANPAWH